MVGANGTSGGAGGGRRRARVSSCAAIVAKSLEAVRVIMTWAGTNYPVSTTLSDHVYDTWIL
jgi:hypothetical protein